MVKNRSIVILLAVLFLVFAKYFILEPIISLERFRFFDFGVSPVLTAGGEIALVPLRIGLAFVFLWFGLDNILHPEGFDNIGDIFLEKLGIKHDFNLKVFAYLQGAVEILIGVAFILGPFLDLAALAGSLVVAGVLIAFQGAVGQLLLRDLGILGGTITLFLLSLK